MKMYKSLSIGVFLLTVVVAQSGCQPSQSRTDEQSSETPAVQQQIEQPVGKPVTEVVEGGPVITIENAVHDFGQMAPGGRDKCDFKFKNTGSGTLKIERVQSTCGCTVPELSKKEYAPGEEGIINVSFHAPNAKAKTTKHLYIVSNDPQNPRAELTISAEVVVKVEVSPENVELRFDLDNAGIPNLVVKSLDDKEFSITGITVSPRNIMNIPFDSTQKAKEFTLEPLVDKEILSASLTGVIQIQTDHPQSGNLVVRYRATPEFEATRPRIILQNMEPGVSVVKDVLIRSNYGKKVEIESYKSRNGYMEIENQEEQDEHLQLQIKITPPEQEASSRRYITDQMDVTLKGGATLTIRCSGWFKLK